MVTKCEWQRYTSSQLFSGVFNRIEVISVSGCIRRLVFDMQFNKIYQKDCIEGMKELEESSIDIIVTSPPYNIGVDYTLIRTTWRLKTT